MNQAFVHLSLVVSNIIVCTNMPFIIWNYITGNICYVVTYILYCISRISFIYIVNFCAILIYVVESKYNINKNI